VWCKGFCYRHAKAKGLGKERKKKKQTRALTTHWKEEDMGTDMAEQTVKASAKVAQREQGEEARPSDGVATDAVQRGPEDGDKKNPEPPWVHNKRVVILPGLPRSPPGPRGRGYRGKQSIKLIYNTRKRQDEKEEAERLKFAAEFAARFGDAEWEEVMDSDAFVNSLV
jgi:hypothetical protein